MKIKIVTTLALTAIAVLGVSAPAQARMHHRHQVCNFDHHHHHRVCHWVG